MKGLFHDISTSGRNIRGGGFDRSIQTVKVFYAQGYALGVAGGWLRGCLIDLPTYQALSASPVLDAEFTNQGQSQA